MVRLHGNRVAVKLDEVTVSAGGLHLIGATGKLRHGTVYAASDEYHTNFGVVRSKFCVGDRVLVDELGGLAVTLDDVSVIIVRNEDVIGTL